MSLMTKKTHITTKNRGFTIVEMLVSVAILVTVIGPLLGGFIVSQRITTKSYYLGEASLVSRNIIETIRAEGIETFLALHGVDLNDTGVYDLDITGIDSSTIANVTVGTSSDVKFDAVVRIDAGAFRGERNEDGELIVDPLINDYLITDYLPMDAVFVQPRGAGLDPDELAIEEFRGELSLLGTFATPAELDVWLYRRYDRIITLDVQWIGTNLSMTVTYDYQLPPSSSTDFTTLDYSISYEIHWDMLELDPVTNEPLPIVAYLFYIPYYAEFSTRPDTIMVRNNIGPPGGAPLPDLPLNVFIVKQRPDPVDPIDEGKYTATLIQWESQMRFSFDGSDKATKLYSNFRENFAGGPTAGPFNTWVRYVESHVDSSPESELLVAQSARDRMFAITIDVYHAGDPLRTNPIYSYDATHLE